MEDTALHTPLAGDLAARTAARDGAAPDHADAAPAATAPGISAAEARKAAKKPAVPVKETSSYSAQHLVARYVIFAVGVLINSFGVALITKGALGTSPISGIPYVLSLQFTSLSFGMTTFVFNLLFIALQIVLLRRDFQPIQLLQLVVNVVFSEFIDVSTGLLGFFEPANLAVQLLCVVLGCVVLAFGISIEVAPNVILVPGEGAVRAIAARCTARFGTVKICFDMTLVAIALVLSLIFFHGIQGLGLGTIISALAVGKVVNLFNTYLPFLERIRQLAR